MRLGIGIEVLILEKSTRSRIAPTARFCILHSYGRTARDLRQKTKEAIRSRLRPPTQERSAESYDTDDGTFPSLLRNSRGLGVRGTSHTRGAIEKRAWQSLAPVQGDGTTIRTK